MRMLRVGCGCVVLVVEDRPLFVDSVVRRIEFCGSDGESLGVSSTFRLGELMNDYNLRPKAVHELTTEEVHAILDRIAPLIRDGYSYRELQVVLKKITRQP